MVSVGFNEDLGRYAWVYRDGESSQLPVAGYEVASVAGVNSAGDVVGLAQAGAPPAMVVWPADTPDEPDLRLTAGSGIVPVSIDDDGAIVGYYEHGARFRVAGG